MRKLLLTTVAIALSLVKGYAIPAAPYPVVLTQPDGATIETRINGDEFYDFRTTADGYTIVQNADGYYVYAQKQNGKLVPTSVVARNAAERSAADRALLKNLGKRLIDDRSVINAKKARNNRTAAMRAPGFDYDNFRGLVILVEWNDVSFLRSDPHEFFSDMIKKRNYTGFTNEDGSRNAYGTYTGSVRDYFYDNSNGVFNPTFDVVGPIKVNFSINEPKKTQNMAKILEQVITKADPLVDFSKYDLDNNGKVDMFYVIFAGVGSNTGETGAANHVWPHASYFDWSKKFDGKSMGRYACSCEMLATDIIDGIGTIAHEFSHVLGLEDLYDTDYDENGRSHDPGAWEIMANGGYNNYGRTPAGYSAYDRYSLGFLSPTVISGVNEYSLKDIVTYNEALLMRTKVNHEFFMFENRQKKKWDSALPGHGMIVARVDSTSAQAWYSNDVNINPAHNYYELLRAGNSTKDAKASDPFPGTAGVTMISNETTPSLKTWNGTQSALVISNISEVGGVIRFNTNRDGTMDKVVEDFENMAVTTDNMLTDVQGNFTKWDFIKSYVDAPGEGKCNGEHAVAMKRPCAITTGKTYYDAYLVNATVFNPSSTLAKFSLSTSTDGGTTWVTQKTSTGSETQSVSPGGKFTATWPVEITKNKGVRYRIMMTAGNANNPCYLDDFTIFITDEGEPVGLIGDVNDDGEVDVKDVTALITYILGTTPDGFVVENANVNEDPDGLIDVQDVTALINMILN